MVIKSVKDFFNSNNANEAGDIFKEVFSFGLLSNYEYIGGEKVDSRLTPLINRLSKLSEKYNECQNEEKKNFLMGLKGGCKGEELPPLSSDTSYDTTKKNIDSIIETVLSKYVKSYSAKINNYQLMLSAVMEMITDGSNVVTCNMLISYVYLAHLDSAKGIVIYSGNKQELTKKFEGWEHEIFLFCHAWFLLSIIIRLKQGLFAENEKFDSTTCPHNILLERITNELLITVETAKTRFDILQCQDFKKYPLAVDKQKIGDIAKKIVKKIEELQEGQEYSLASGYSFVYSYVDSNNNTILDGEGHALYVSFMKKDNDIYIRIDNRGAGVGEKFHNYDKNKNMVLPQIITNVSSSGLMNNKDFVSYVEKVCCRSLAEETILPINTSNTTQIAQALNQHRVNLLETGVYEYKFTFTQKPSIMLQNFPTAKPRKIQSRAGNCVVQSWEVGQAVRLKDWDLYKWVKYHERIFAVSLFKAIPKMDFTKLLTPSNSLNEKLLTVSKSNDTNVVDKTRELLVKGAQLIKSEERSHNGWTALHWANYHGKKELIDEIKKYCPEAVNIKSSKPYLGGRFGFSGYHTPDDIFRKYHQKVPTKNYGDYFKNFHIPLPTIRLNFFAMQPQQEISSLSDTKTLSFISSVSKNVTFAVKKSIKNVGKAGLIATAIEGIITLVTGCMISYFTNEKEAKSYVPIFAIAGTLIASIIVGILDFLSRSLTVNKYSFFSPVANDNDIVYHEFINGIKISAIFFLLLSVIYYESPVEEAKREHKGPIGMVLTAYVFTLCFIPAIISMAKLSPDLNTEKKEKEEHDKSSRGCYIL